jgi:hypothetical protein
MSLATCLRQLGPSLHAADRQLLREHIKGGLSEAEALEQVIGKARSDLDATLERIQQAGGKVRMAHGGLYQRAWHGSPHVFERFDSSKIGTGEGAQVYGYGHYFSSQRQIAEWYRKKLAGSPRVLVGGKEVDRVPAGIQTPREQAVNDLRQEYERELASGKPASSVSPEAVVAAARERLQEIVLNAQVRVDGSREYLAEYEQGDRTMLTNAGEALKEQRYLEGAQRDLANVTARAAALEQLAKEGVEFRAPGRTYEVEVPEDHELMNLDKPLLEQPANVQRAVKEAGVTIATAADVAEAHQAYLDAYAAFEKMKKSGPFNPKLMGATERTFDHWQALRDASDMTGEDAYKRLTQSLGSDWAASDVLRKHGIKGHTYVGLSSGEKNYVIYDDKAIEPKAYYRRSGAVPASTGPDIQALMDRVMAKPTEHLTIRDRLRQTWRKLTDINGNSIRQGVVDAFDAIKRLEEGTLGALADAADSPYKAALATKNLPSVMAAVMLRGAPVYKNGAFQLEPGRKGLVEIFNPLTDNAKGNLLPLWELYAAARREADVMAAGRPGYKPLFTDPERAKALDLAREHPELEQVRKDWETFNHQILDLAVERGVLNAQSVARWKQSFYVPFYREQEDEHSGAPRGGGEGLEGHGGQKARKQLMGSEKPLGHVFENLLMNTAYLVDESFKNTAMQKIVDLADGVAMAKAPEGARSGNDVVRVFRNGHAEHYKVLDDLLLRSIANMGHQNFAGMLNVLGLLTGPKHLLTHAITLDPAFMMANLFRDTLATWVQSHAGMTPILDAVKGIRSAFNMDSDTLAIMAAGGGGGGVYDMQPPELRKFLVDKMGSASAARRFEATIVSPKSWLRLWRKIGNAAENANRVAVYKAVRKNGGSVAEAAYQARDVLNFAMSGDFAAMRWLTATVPFMNARVQGLYRLYRGAAENPVSFALKGGALAAATLALLLRNQNGDDKDKYEALDDWDKDAYWHFWLDGEHFRFPKPFEVGSIFGTIPERVARLLEGKDTPGLAIDRLESMLSSTFAFNPIPQVAKPLIEQYANKTFYFGSPIVGPGEIDLKPEAQYTPWTSETMRAMASALPEWAPDWLRSPERLEALLRAYTGSLSTYLLSGADALTRKVAGAPEQPARTIYDAPVVRRFLQDPNPRNTKYAGQLYEMLDQSNAIFSTINRYREQGRVAEAAEMLNENRGKLAVRARLTTIATQVKNINNQIRLAMYSTKLSAEEKRDRIGELQAKKNAVTARVAPLADLF